MTRQANEIMDEATAEATIDEALRRDPSNMVFPDDYVPLIEAMRTKRALFIDAGEKKEAKKQGIGEQDDKDSE